MQKNKAWSVIQCQICLQIFNFFVRLLFCSIRDTDDAVPPERAEPVG